MDQMIVRYTAEVARHVPSQGRAGVAADVAVALDASVETLVAAGLPADEAERAAVSALGDPADVAAKYGGYPRHLIGPAYYGEWERLVKTLLAIVPAAVGGALILAQALAGLDPTDMIGSALGAAFTVAVQLTFWVTVVFAVMERKGTLVAARTWSPEDLPAAADHRISLTETALGVAGLTLLIWAMLWQRTHWLVTASNGAQVPVLNPDLWDLWLPLLVGILVVSIVLAIANYRVGHWTVPTAVLNTVLNVAFAGIVLWLWEAGELVNPAVVDVLPQGVDQLLGVLPWVVVLIGVWDTAAGWWGVRRRA